MNAGDLIGLKPGTSDLHFIQNTTSSEVRFLVIAPTSEKDLVSYGQSQSESAPFRIALDDTFYISDITTTDKPAFVEHLQERQIYNQTLSIPYPYTEADAEWWVNHVAEMTEKRGNSLVWAIRRADGFLIGAIGYHDFQIGKSHKAEIGYWLAKPYWGQGIMTKAVKKVTEFGFKEFRLARVVAPIFHSNVGSARVLEKAGYLLEGILRNEYKKDGKFFDGKVYARVAESWPTD